jgi:cytoskeletal protein RodZ
MEVKMQTSFIPKKPITESRVSGSGVSLFLLLSIILFITAITLALGVWLWQKSLVSQIEKDKTALEAARNSYEADTIDSLVRLDNRIEESKALLASHVAVSPVFIMLEKNVLKNIRLKTMKFSDGTDHKIRVELSGTASSYGALSKQSDAFGSESLRKFISEPVISDFSPTADGSVSFNFSALVDQNLVSYGNTLDSSVVQ